MPQTKHKVNRPRNYHHVPKRHMPPRAARDASSNHANSAASAASTGTTNNKEKHRNAKITNSSMETVCDYIVCSVHMYIYMLMTYSL